jgi:hypothetical protein
MHFLTRKAQSALKPRKEKQASSLALHLIITFDKHEARAIANSLPDL